jgi:oligopeptidase B
MAKQHSVDDFVAAGSLLVEKGYAHPDRLAGQGGSAGGLVIGAVANQAPGRFRALHGQVPFVDVLTTMLDPSLPLTAGSGRNGATPSTTRRRTHT